MNRPDKAAVCRRRPQPRSELASEWASAAASAAAGAWAGRMTEWGGRGLWNSACGNPPREGEGVSKIGCMKLNRQHPIRRPRESGDPYAVSRLLRDAVRRLSRNNGGLWLWVPARASLGRDDGREAAA